MKIHQHPELLERIAAAYALGTLRGGARRRFETMAREQAPVRAAALIWQGRLSSINELQTGAEPDPAVWTRINNLVQADRERARVQALRNAPPPVPGGFTTWLRSLALWRGISAAGAMATVAAVMVGLNVRQDMGSEIAALQSQLQAAPQIEYVAVLADDRSAASMLVTIDAKKQKLTLQRLGDFQEAGDKSLQLWALPPSGTPKSLGVLGGERLLRLTAGESDVNNVPALAISLEPKGGVPGEGGPTGPVLFKGALIQKML
jgi:anti-sigma-K factor RskA